MTSRKKSVHGFAILTGLNYSHDPREQTLLELLDLPGTYSRLIEELREPIANVKGVLSVLAPTTFTTRNDLVDSIER